MSHALEQATRKLERANRLVRFGWTLLILYFVTITGIIVYQQFVVIQQQQTALEQSIKDNAEQHSRTQNYIKCIAGALLIPLAQRESDAFDKCGISATPPAQNTQSAQTSSVPSSPQALPPEPITTTTPASQEPTTSSPPDPDPSEQGPATDRGVVLNLVDGLLNIPRSLLGDN